MKKRNCFIVSCGLILLLATGCGSTSTGHTTQNNNVDNVLNQQVEKEAGTDQSTDTQNTAEQSADNSSKTGKAVQSGQKKTSESTDTEVDYDLTQMGSDMVYATVYQLMAAPDDYIGKTIKMNGLCYTAYYEPTEQYYHYCIIADASACCSQGIEFVCKEKNFKYPEDNSEITVTGIFETYQEENDPNLYCRLKNAVMEADSDK